ncbi:MAG: hypothetical protein ACFNLW_07175 [Olsenella sp.]
MNDIPQIIDLVSIELTGSEFRTEQETALRQKLKTEPFAVMVRGQQSIAAGAGLSQSLVVFLSNFASDVIVPDLLYDLFKYVLSRTCKALSETMDFDVPLNGVTFKARDCDYIISSNCNAGVYSESIDCNQLLSQMESFAKREEKNNRPVAKIESPCDLRIGQHRWEAVCCGVGNYSLWKVEYKSGEKWPEALYDAANETFIELVDDEISCPEDKFYAGQ